VHLLGVIKLMFEERESCTPQFHISSATLRSNSWDAAGQFWVISSSRMCYTAIRSLVWVHNLISHLTVHGLKEFKNKLLRTVIGI